MPNRHYIPSGGSWPRWLDHLGAHLNDFGISVIALFLGTLVLIGTTDKFHASLFLIPLDSQYEVALAIPLMLGGALGIAATLIDFKQRATYWAMLRSGLILESIGWLSYGCTIAAVAGQPAVSSMLAIGLGILRLARFGRTLLDEYRIRNLAKDQK